MRRAKPPAEPGEARSGSTTQTRKDQTMLTAEQLQAISQLRQAIATAREAATPTNRVYASTIGLEATKLQQLAQQLDEATTPPWE